MTTSANAPSVFVYVDFMAQIKLTRSDLDAAGGDVARAVQNEIGPVGAVLLEIEDEEERND